MNRADILFDIIKERRTIFPHQFSGEIIPDETVKKILETAVWAPTHGKTQPWFFYVLTGESLKNFINFKASLYRKYTSEADFNEMKFRKISERAEQASHIIVMICKAGSNPKIPLTEEIEAVACAAQNMQLMSSALHVGSFWATGDFTEMEEMRSEFGLGENDYLLGFLYLGIPQKDLITGSTRKGIEEKSQWI